MDNTTEKFFVPLEENNEPITFIGGQRGGGRIFSLENMVAFLKESLKQANQETERWKSAALYYLEKLATVQKWIPVSEPPKERGCYLISVKHWLDGKPVTREAFWNGADWLSCYCKKGDRVELTPRVTHWMPLPEPPRGDTE